MARMVVKMGSVNINAVTSARGVMERAKKNASMQDRFNTPRATCRPGRLVLSGCQPSFTNHGRTTIRLKTSRKKAISNGCRSPETNRTRPCKELMHSVPTAIQKMPRSLSAHLAGAKVCGI